MTFVFRYLLILLLVHMCSAAQSGKRVMGVLFVESDTTGTKEMERAVLRQVKLVQRQWLKNFKRTFHLDDDPVRVIQADHTGHWYENTRSPEAPGNTRDPRWYRLENIRMEVIRKLNLDEDIRVLVYPTSKRDGHVGAYIGTPIGQGGYMDFDDITCVYGAGESTPYDNSEAICGAHELHEMGHIFGLEHEGPNEDCMQFGFYKDWGPAKGMCKFFRDNRRKVKRSSVQKPWMPLRTLDEATPSPSPNPAETCKLEDECNSNEIVNVQIGKLFWDSCSRQFRVRNNCSLRFIRCMYRDACDQSVKIPAQIGDTIRDLCDNEYVVEDECSLVRLCRYSDACNNTPIVEKVGDVFTDGCGIEYRVLDDCGLERT